MMEFLPSAEAVPLGDDKEKIKAQVRKKFTGSLANNTKWNELIEYIRGFEGWKPPYRSKWVNGYITEWDGEWCYHLPFPFVGVEWFDMKLHQHIFTGQLTPKKIIDHSPLIINKLQEIGLEFEVKGNVVRIWGYSPKSYEDFPPETPA